MNSREDLEKQRISNREIAGSGVSDNVSAINRLGEGIRNTAFTLSIFLFTFSSPIFADFQDLELGLWQKIGLFISWLFLFLSILFGLIQVLVNLYFHKDILDLFIKRDNIWSDLLPGNETHANTKFEEMYDESTSLYDSEKPVSSPSWSTKLQMLFLLLGFVLIIVVATCLLFSLESNI